MLSNFRSVELVVPTNRPDVHFDWLTGVAQIYGLSYRGLETPSDPQKTGCARIFRGNVLRFNTRPAKSAGMCEDVLRYTPQELTKEPNLVRSLGSFVRQKGGPAARAFRLWLIENKFLTEKEADEQTLFTSRVTVLGEGQMTAPEGLHADFPDVDDEGLFRSTVGGEREEDNCEVRHFILLSGPPATQFFQKPVSFVSSSSSWRLVEQQLPFQDATVRENAVTFPAGTVIEFYNDSIHRPQTFYRDQSEGNRGQERQVRLMLRACFFRNGFPPGPLLSTNSRNSLTSTYQIPVTPCETKSSCRFTIRSFSRDLE